MTDAELQDRVAIITGGSSGIGLAVAVRFAKAGAIPVILALNEDHLTTARSQIEQVTGPGRSLAIACDVTREDQVIHAFQTTIDHYKHIDVIVNNAGTGYSAPVEDTPLNEFQKLMDVHVNGYFLVARQAVRVFKTQAGGGVMVFVVSDNSLRPSRNALAYNVAKAAELHMARCLAEECGRYHIRVNSVLPGAVFGGSKFWTPEFRAARAAIHGFNPANLEEEYKKNTALGVIIMPDEVAEVVLFLASDRSAKMTGTALSIDGGGTAGYVR
jgi:NAD(P)-dependent dehydrogenase (short-subunit alcohol dehydrogenase family)